MKKEIKDFIKGLDDMTFVGRLVMLFLVGLFILLVGFVLLIVTVGVFSSPTSTLMVISPFVIGYGFYYFGKKWTGETKKGGKH